MSPIIVGQPIADNVLNQVREHILELKKQNVHPRLAVILVGDDGPSQTYVNKKGLAATSVGIEFDLYHFAADTTTDQLVAAILDIQKNHSLSGLIVQLPLPKHIDSHTVLNTINENIDIDCLSDKSLGRLVTGSALFIPPTVGAIMSILENQNIQIPGKKITIVGSGTLVGKPLAITLMNMNATVTVCNSATADLLAHTSGADIIVSGVGKKNLITADMIKPGAVIIDAGVEIINGKSYGDADVPGISAIAAITPTPGGVGPVTVAKLLENTAIAASRLLQS